MISLGDKTDRLPQQENPTDMTRVFAGQASTVLYDVPNDRHHEAKISATDGGARLAGKTQSLDCGVRTTHDVYPKLLVGGILSSCRTNSTWASDLGERRRGRPCWLKTNWKTDSP
ncbi:hypothetical protein GE09DRAFT_1218271 [Coniochaeta sp. 2T2.1]|nr:hypothetical protein GE09DRAFT_1218271 [Coniochaeta sp. 2T2.1]